MTTRKDVAKVANVSPSTVSRVLNKNGYVAEEVRKRVLEAIKDTGYVPNRAARSLRLNNYRQIACVVQSITNPFYSRIVEGIEEIASHHGYSFSLYKTNADNSDQMKFLLEGANDGVIMLAPMELKKMESLDKISERIPTVLYKDFETPTSISHVYVDLRKTITIAVNHLVQNGHKNILFLGYEFQSSMLKPGGFVKDPRYLGFLQGMERNNLLVGPGNLAFIELNKDTLSMGYESISKFCKEKLPFTAIVAANDLLAIGAMRGLVELGYQVPDDISIIGMDDIELAKIVSPSLTTLRIPARRIGNQLMELLLEKINGKEEANSVAFETELTSRESVKQIDNHTVLKTLIKKEIN